MKKSLIICLMVLFSHIYGEILIEGKTKIVESIDGNIEDVLITSKDDLTAFNKEKHDILEGKGAIATETNCNVFNLLKQCNVPVAFKKQVRDTQFVALKCEMIPYEVVIRREAHGSYLKRNPQFNKGDVFSNPIVEFYLKTSDRMWEGQSIPKDDPYIVFNEEEILLFDPDQPLSHQPPFAVLRDYPLKGEEELFKQMKKIAKQVFFILEKSWQNLGLKLVDLKIEFGFDPNDRLVVADVIDNDSWRVLQGDVYQDKQFYRDGGDLNEVDQKYRFIQEKTREFKLPKQQIIISPFQQCSATNR